MVTLEEMKLFAEQTKSEFWVLILLVDDYDPAENLWHLLVATPEQMADTVDLENLPENMTLLKGKQAREFLVGKLRENEKWQAESQLRRFGLN